MQKFNSIQLYIQYLLVAVTITTSKKMYDVPDNGSSELD